MKLERQVDVRSADGTGVRGTGRAQDIASASKSKDLKDQPIPTSASIHSLCLFKPIVSFLLPPRADIEILLSLVTITLKAFT